MNLKCIFFGHKKYRRYRLKKRDEDIVTTEIACSRCKNIVER